MTESGRGTGLRTIFSFFLGLMLCAFIGVGVYTFYPQPERFEEQIKDLDRSEQALTGTKSPDELSAEDQQRLREYSRRRMELSEAAAEARKPWGRNTSIVLITLATLAMAVSLVRAEQLPVISNGLLMGGVFTMLYGVGWIVATDRSVTRFLVMTAALLITLGLGYVRFVRRRAPEPVAAGAAVPVGAELAGLERRVHDLETRLDAASRALGDDRDR